MDWYEAPSRAPQNSSEDRKLYVPVTVADSLSMSVADLIRSCLKYPITPLFTNRVGSLLIHLAFGFIHLGCNRKYNLYANNQF